MKVENSKSGEKGINPLDELVGEIKYLNDEYRAGNSQASDQYYDSLLERLVQLDPTNPLLKKGVIEAAPEGRRKRAEGNICDPARKAQSYVTEVEVSETLAE